MQKYCLLLSVKHDKSLLSDDFDDPPPSSAVTWLVLITTKQMLKCVSITLKFLFL